MARALHFRFAMRLHPVSFYVHELKRRLPARCFEPAASRLWWLPLHLAVIAGATLVIAERWLPWPLDLPLSLAIGLSFGGLAFLGHETLHGGVVRGRWAWLKPIVGWICFAPFVLSQKLWVAWHNRIHHATTNRLGVDPDMYPSIEAYRARRTTRFSVDNFALGGRRWRGVLSLILGFTVQSKDMLLKGPRRLQMTRGEYAQVIAETLAGVAMWTALALVIGGVPFVFAFVLPSLVGNAVVIAFILTNHSLSPATEINDPLINSLSVTAPRWLEWLTLDFGYHVEHHLFASMSGRHARTVRAGVLERWPGRYQTMSIGAALARLHRTGRVYEDATTLVDPRTGAHFPTLAPRDDDDVIAPVAAQHAAR